ncbi:MAG: N-acetylmuramoyl-L-alanine amidase [Thermosynechococcaceae cyanobacterium]
MGQWLKGTKRQQGVRAITLLASMASAIALSLLAMPAEASRLQFWRFDTTRNRLEFTTDATIKPRVQLIPNPVRLVVDLPGVQLGQPTINQNYSAAIRSIRVGQFDAQTARIVVELSPGYTVDPQQVKVQGASPLSWSVELPTPQLGQASPEMPLANGFPPDAGGSTALANPLPPPDQTAPTPVAEATTPNRNNRLEDIWVTSEGLFLKTQQAVAGVQISRNSSRKEITFDVSGLWVDQPFTQNEYKMDYHGIQRVSIRQFSTQPPVARLTLRVDRRSPDWLASTSRFGGVVLLPQGGSAKVPNSKQPTRNISLISGKPTTTGSSQPTPDPGNGSRSLATLQNLALGGSQLLIQTDRPAYYTTGWEGTRYRITLRDAQLSRLRVPRPAAGSPLSDLSLRQDGQNVSILATPASGVRVGTIGRVDNQTLVVNLTRLGTTTNPIFQQSLPSPSNASTFAQPTLSQPNGRRIVVIDPGHGGPDVGAIGIGGLRETNIVLPMSLEVARLLQQQGLQVYLTRTDESRDVDLPPRVALAQQVRADVFVSIHANSINMSRPDINGAETYYAPGSASGAELAKTILNSITRSVNIRSRGVHSARFYVIRHTTMPATLVETGFVTGAEDAPKLGDPGFQRQMAAAIAQGIIEFLNRR